MRWLCLSRAVRVRIVIAFGFLTTVATSSPDTIPDTIFTASFSHQVPASRALRVEVELNELLVSGAQTVTIELSPVTAGSGQLVIGGALLSVLSEQPGSAPCAGCAMVSKPFLEVLGAGCSDADAGAGDCEGKLTLEDICPAGDSCRLVYHVRQADDDAPGSVKVRVTAFSGFNNTDDGVRWMAASEAAARFDDE